MDKGYCLFVRFKFTYLGELQTNLTKDEAYTQGRADTQDPRIEDVIVLKEYEWLKSPA